MCIFSSRFSPYRQHPLISRSSLSFRFFFLSRVILKPLRFDWTFSVFQCQNERGMRECFRSNDFSVYTQCLFRNWPRDYLVYEIISLFLLNSSVTIRNEEKFRQFWMSISTFHQSYTEFRSNQRFIISVCCFGRENLKRELVMQIYISPIAINRGYLENGEGKGREGV